jgi:hypothetical protein
LTVLLALVIAVLVWSELRAFLFGDPGYEFTVDKAVGELMAINVDMTVAMPCHCKLSRQPLISLIDHSESQTSPSTSETL